MKTAKDAKAAEENSFIAVKSRGTPFFGRIFLDLYFSASSASSVVFIPIVR